MSKKYIQLTIEDIILTTPPVQGAKAVNLTVNELLTCNAVYSNKSLLYVAIYGANSDVSLPENNFFVGSANNRVSKKTLAETKLILGIGEPTAIITDNNTLSGDGTLGSPLQISNVWQTQIRLGI